MRWSLKIAVYGFLTYIVFALANWVGPVRQFLPLIYFDLIILSILSVLFVFHRPDKIAFPALLFLALSIIISSLVEFMAAISLPYSVLYFVFVFLICAWIFHLVDFFTSSRELPLIHQIFWILFILSNGCTLGMNMVGIYYELTGLPYWISPVMYWISGLLGIAWCLYADRSHLPKENTYRFVLLYSLSVLFDLINYFSLYAAATA